MSGRAMPAALVALRDRLTPGQWWTVALALALAVGMLAFGLPGPRVVPGIARAPGADAGEPLHDEAADPIFDRTSRSVSPAPGGAPAAPDPSRDTIALAAPRRRDVPEPATSPGTRVAALVRASSASVPGRDEASIASAFLARNGISATFVTLDGPEAEVCRTVVAEADFAVAGHGLPRALGSCVEDGGVTVLSYDVRGGGPTTARGIAASLVEADALPGRVGVVVSRDLAEEAEVGVALARARGVDVVAVERLAPDAEPVAIAEGVRRFSEARVESVAFAVPVAQQSQWGGQQVVLTPGVRFVVLDAADAVYNEAYPASFDGARAYTTIGVPWHAREHGESPEQAVCRQAHEAQAAGGSLSADERVMVFLWCQHAALLRAILDGVGAGIPVDEVLSARRYASPLTSELGSRGGVFGPMREAELRWTAACSCWEPVRGFEERVR